MQKGIAVAGNLIVDYVKRVDAYPGPGMLSNVLGVKRGVGGCAANTAMDLKGIDAKLRVSCLGKVGRDGNGDYIKKTLSDRGVDISGISECDEPTSFTDVMSDAATGERTFFHARGANARFGPDDVDLNSLNADIFHIGYALLLDAMDAPGEDGGTRMAGVLAEAQRLGMKTSMDVVSENGERFNKVVSPSLKYCSYAIMNEIEASRVTGIAIEKGEGLLLGLRGALSRLLELGVSECAAVHMPELGCAMDKRGNFCAVKSLKLPKGYVKGSVGAGDAFCAGMLYGLYNGWAMEDCLKFASGAAACSLSAENATDGMKDAQSIERLCAQYGGGAV